MICPFVLFFLLELHEKAVTMKSKSNNGIIAYKIRFRNNIRCYLFMTKRISYLPKLIDACYFSQIMYSEYIFSRIPTFMIICFAEYKIRDNLLIYEIFFIKSMFEYINIKFKCFPWKTHEIILLRGKIVQRKQFRNGLYVKVNT